MYLRLINKLAYACLSNVNFLDKNKNLLNKKLCFNQTNSFKFHTYTIQKNYFLSLNYNLSL